MMAPPENVTRYAPCGELLERKDYEALAFSLGAHVRSCAECKNIIISDWLEANGDA